MSINKRFPLIQVSASAANPWEEVHVAIGIAAYDPETDGTVHDTIRRADKTMYENKRIEKEKAGSQA